MVLLATQSFVSSGSVSEMPRKLVPLSGLKNDSLNFPLRETSSSAKLSICPGLSVLVRALQCPRKLEHNIRTETVEAAKTVD